MTPPAGSLSGIEHIFLLMLENRSFDHMLGFSGITGTDAVTQTRRPIDGLTGSESNSWNGTPHRVCHPADYVMPIDPGHEFCDVLTQLAGPDACCKGDPYPIVVNTGFVASYAAHGGSSNLSEIMMCYGPEQLPVLNALAQEFALCDNWHASMPGPTFPNRFFSLAASSGGLDHSPSTWDVIVWAVAGHSFKMGTIFDRLSAAQLTWRIYAGDDFPVALALEGVGWGDITPYSSFAADVARQDYPAAFTLIEPRYNFLADYQNGTSQHPRDDVRCGEVLLKRTYEAIRNSPVWNASLLIVTWDEHGGFYDHAAAPAPAQAPGDTQPGDPANRYGFAFQNYGPRVPAVIVSPLIQRNIVDRRLYDHASIPAAIEGCFGLQPLTKRDASVGSPMALVTLGRPRADTPATLPSPADGGLTCDDMATVGATKVSEPSKPVDGSSLPGFLYIVLRTELALSPPRDQNEILRRFATIRTRGEALQYVSLVQQKVSQARLARPK